MPHPGPLVLEEDFQGGFVTTVLRKGGVSQASASVAELSDFSKSCWLKTS
jgi:hypothetical protein